LRKEYENYVIKQLGEKEKPSYRSDARMINMNNLIKIKKTSKEFKTKFQGFSSPFPSRVESITVSQIVYSRELEERYKEYGLCQECNQPKTSQNWCKGCNAQHFAQDFDK